MEELEAPHQAAVDSSSASVPEPRPGCSKEDSAAQVTPSKGSLDLLQAYLSEEDEDEAGSPGED